MRPLFLAGAPTCSCLLLMLMQAQAYRAAPSRGGRILAGQRCNTGTDQQASRSGRGVAAKAGPVLPPGLAAWHAVASCSSCSIRVVWPQAAYGAQGRISEWQSVTSLCTKRCCCCCAGCYRTARLAAAKPAGDVTCCNVAPEQTQAAFADLQDTSQQETAQQTESKQGTA